MKGLTHFISGAALASFVVPAVKMASRSLILEGAKKIQALFILRDTGVLSLSLCLINMIWLKRRICQI